VTTYYKIPPLARTIFALFFLFFSLISLNDALRSGDIQGNGRGVDFGAVFLSSALVLLFGLGWWIGTYLEGSIQDKRKKILFISFLAILFIFDIVLFTAIIPSGFWHYGLIASNLIFGSGLFFRWSVLR
jgi:hypothetical protein